MSTVRVLLSVAVNHNWPLFQMDVKNAFLHGDLEEEVYMKMPHGHPQESEANKVCKLHKFAIKDLGTLKYFLGIEMATFAKGLFLNQRKYVIDLLEETNMLDCKAASTPLVSKLQLDAPSELISDPSVYQRVVGKLIYLTITRPDIAYSVSIGRGLLMKKNGSYHIMAYTDADWAGNALDRKSTTGFCTFVGGSLVTWKSKKQTVIARSNAEVECRAMATTACELIWLKSLLVDLGHIDKEHMSLFCDNQAAMHIASNPVFHERTKHIEVDCHFIRAQVQSKVINTIYTRNHDQLADWFTKALYSTNFQRLLHKLRSINPLDPA
ncbi:unnamed protein product [Malus baccata var. baccata]